MSFIKDFKELSRYDEFLDIRDHSSGKTDSHSNKNVDVGYASSVEKPIKSLIKNKVGIDRGPAIKILKSKVIEIAQTAIDKIKTEIPKEYKQFFNFTASTENIFVNATIPLGDGVPGTLRDPMNKDTPNITVNGKKIVVATLYQKPEIANEIKLSEIKIKNEELEVEGFDIIIVGNGVKEGAIWNNFKQEIIFAKKQ